jgi:hypothetical protein
LLAGIQRYNTKIWNGKQVREASLHLSKSAFQESIITFIASKIHSPV